MSELTKEERDRGIHRLCRLLGATRADICDPMMSVFYGAPASCPIAIERWMNWKGIGPSEGESLAEALTRHFGKEAAELAQRLV